MSAIRLNRREFLKLTATTVAGSTIAPVSAASRAVRASTIKAIAFDAFAIYDPRPIFARAEELFPRRGAELSNLWRTKQFEYTWLRGLAGNYTDFWQVTEEALVFAAKLLKLKLGDLNRRQLMASYFELKTWPDVPPALSAFERSGIRMALLSNFTPTMLRAAATSARLETSFEHQLSADAVRTYKPDPRAYQLAIDAFKLDRKQIAYVAFGSWDAAGARTFGFPTFWSNRQNLPSEELGVEPDASSGTLAGLLKFAGVSD